MERIYLTKKGFKKLKEELEKTQEKIRKIVKKGMSTAFHPDELDPEYRDRNLELNWLKEREVELNSNIRNAEEIRTPPKDKQDIVNLGAKVVVEVDGQADEFEIVGSLEAEPSVGRISNESLVGKALLGKRVGEKITVSSSPETIYLIKKISYPSSR